MEEKQRKIRINRSVRLLMGLFTWSVILHLASDLMINQFSARPQCRENGVEVWKEFTKVIVSVGAATVNVLLMFLGIGYILEYAQVAKYNQQKKRRAMNIGLTIMMYAVVIVYYIVSRIKVGQNQDLKIQEESCIIFSAFLRPFVILCDIHIVVSLGFLMIELPANRQNPCGREVAEPEPSLNCVDVQSV